MVDIKETEPEEISCHKKCPVKMYIDGRWHYFTEAACKEILVYLSKKFEPQKTKREVIDEAWNEVSEESQKQFNNIQRTILEAFSYNCIEKFEKLLRSRK